MVDLIIHPTGTAAIEYGLRTTNGTVGHQPGATVGLGISLTRPYPQDITPNTGRVKVDLYVPNLAGVRRGYLLGSISMPLPLDSAVRMELGMGSALAEPERIFRGKLGLNYALSPDLVVEGRWAKGAITAGADHYIGLSYDLAKWVDLAFSDCHACPSVAF